MERSNVICHMVTSIDGKISGNFEKEPLVETSVFPYYYQALFEFGAAMATGRATNEETLKIVGSAEIDFSKYSDTEVDYEDYIIKDPNQHYFVSFDRKGRCNWGTSHFEHLGKRLLLVEVLTKKAKKEYLAYLREVGIPYIFAGEEEMDIELALKKLKSEFGVETLVLCGGAVINGAFFKEDLIDEISLTVAPYVEGNRDEKSFVELWADYHNTAFPLKKATPIDGGGVHLLFAREGIKKEQ
ncbi:dihydrofolate reductase family protein [Enterococcus massiliensis]|uniref:dihydrofolate reductase family protein n=1 Tax=Enterococcus massiliensis TaxID=1640685 RepID=UPI00065DC852|nr:dihydrofolate reductase family protein [Enterococcus massiliensis]